MGNMKEKRHPVNEYLLQMGYLENLRFCLLASEMQTYAHKHFSQNFMYSKFSVAIAD